MKKLISLILVVVLAFAGFAASAEDITGTWYLTEAVSEGLSIDPSTLGMEMTLVLNADGTGALAALGQEMACTWTFDGQAGTIDLGDDGTTAFTCDGTTLSIDVSGTVMNFSRTASEAFTRPAEVYVQDIAAFNGTWSPVKFGIAGVYVDASLLTTFGVDADTFALMNIVIENGNVDFMGEPIVFSLVDGLLFAETTDAEVQSSYRVQLLEGDMIEIDSSVLPVTLVCARAQAQQQAA